MTGLKMQNATLAWKSYLFKKKNETLNDLLGTTMLLRTVDTEKCGIPVTEMLRNGLNGAKRMSPTVSHFSVPWTESYRPIIIPLPTT